MFLVRDWFPVKAQGSGICDFPIPRALIHNMDLVHAKITVRCADDRLIGGRDMKQTIVIVVVVLALAAGFVAAEEKFGVLVYPGAKYDAETSKALKDMMKMEAACYRTGDPISKIAEFYQKQELKSVGDVTKEGALFRKGKIDVTMQSPWMNMKTGAMMKDTLISIVKNKE